jgi:SulP family sulfate permease
MERLGRWVSVVEWAPRYRRAYLRGDLVSGVTGAAVLVPQGMAYAQIAGLPPVVGLYASVLPLIAYALLGRSPQLGVGPLASISVLSAVGVARLAPDGTARFVALAATLALIVGLVHVGIGVARLGSLTRFLSEPAMRGFLAGVGVLVIATQLGALCGFHVPTASRVGIILVDWIDRLDDFSASSLALGVATIVALLVLKRWPRFPGTLAVLVGATILSAVFSFDQHGILVVGHVPAGLPGFALPTFSWGDLDVLAPTALAITMVSIIESLALARRYADEHHTTIEPNAEIAALGGANITAGCFQGMVVTGAMTRSEIMDESGARTQLALLVSVAVVTPLLVFATGLFDPIPLPVLAGVVVVAVLPFISPERFRQAWRDGRTSGLVMTATFLATIFLGVDVSVAVVVLLSAVVAVAGRRVTPPDAP